MKGDLGLCSACDRIGENRAHVKDKASFKKGHDHSKDNIVILCMTCHYELFDEGKMLLAQCKCGEYIFIKPSKDGDSFFRIKSNRRLSIRKEYIEAKADQAKGRRLRREYLRIRRSCGCGLCNDNTGFSCL